MPDSNSNDTDEHKDAVKERDAANADMRDTLLNKGNDHEAYMKSRERLNAAVMKEQDSARPTPSDEEVRKAHEPRNREATASRGIDARKVSQTEDEKKAAALAASSGKVDPTANKTDGGYKDRQTTDAKK